MLTGAVRARLARAGSGTKKICCTGTGANAPVPTPEDENVNVNRLRHEIDLLAQEGATLAPYERGLVRSFVQHARLLLRTLYGIKAECSKAKLAALATARRARATKRAKAVA